jgi:polyvinyl alcohol dehydrogenase (cytochrome)
LIFAFLYTFHVLKRIVFILPLLATWIQAQPSGEAVYKRRCAACHSMPDARTPGQEALQRLTASRILKTLDFGVMMTIAYAMKRDEREAVAAYLGRPGNDAPPQPQAFCSDRTVNLAHAQGWNGWSPEPNNARFQSAGLTLDQTRRLKLKWVFGFEGDTTAFAQPTVLGSTLFTGSAHGRVYALDTATGCMRWFFEASGPVRTAIVAAPIAGGRHILLFSDLIGWVYGVDAADGRQIWKKKIEQHEATRLTGAPAVHNGVAYFPAASWEETRSTNPEYECCTFRGSITALRVADGARVWKTFMIREAPTPRAKTSAGTQTWGPSGAGVWSTPTVDLKRNILYVSTGDNYSAPATDTSDAIMALDMKTGRILWSRQMLPGDMWNSACGNKGPSCPEGAGPDFDFGSSVILQRMPDGRDMLFAGQKSGVVYALDPDKKGAIVWQTRVGRGTTNGGVQWGMSSDGQKLYAAVNDSLRVNGGLDPNVGGGLTALRLADGAKAWFAAPAPCAASRKNCSPGQSAALTSIPGVVFSGSLDGHIRGFSTETGQVLWDYDTAHEYQTVNGVKAVGGSLDGPGAVVANGMLFLNSGYPRFGGMPGNVLLAFGVE